MNLFLKIKIAFYSSSKKKMRLISNLKKIMILYKYKKFNQKIHNNAKILN